MNGVSPATHIIWYYIILYYIILYYILYYMMLYFMIWYYILLYDMILYLYLYYIYIICMLHLYLCIILVCLCVCHKGCCRDSSGPWMLQTETNQKTKWQSAQNPLCNPGASADFTSILMATDTLVGKCTPPHTVLVSWSVTSGEKIIQKSSDGTPNGTPNGCSKECPRVTSKHIKTVGSKISRLRIFPVSTVPGCDESYE